MIVSSLVNSGVSLVLGKCVTGESFNKQDLVKLGEATLISAFAGKMVGSLIPRGAGAYPQKLSTALLGTVGVNKLWRQGGMQGLLEAGLHSIVWNTSAYSSGIYFYQLQSLSSSKTKKMILLR